MEIGNNGEIKEKVLNIVKNYVDEMFADKEIEMNESLADLGMDSFNVIYMLLDIEDAFGVQIPDNMLTPELFESAETIHNAVLKLLVNESSNL